MKDLTNHDVCNIQLELVLTPGITLPKWKSVLPYVVVSNNLSKESQVVTQVISIDVPNDCNELVLKNIGKTDSETIVDNGKIVADQVLKVNKIWANNIAIEIDAVKSAFEFYPAYSTDNVLYASENGIELEKVINTTEMFFNGSWEFKFDRPFFVWYNKILKAEIARTNHWALGSHLGHVTEEQINQLESLVKELS